MLTARQIRQILAILSGSEEKWECPTKQTVICLNPEKLTEQLVELSTRPKKHEWWTIHAIGSLELAKRTFLQNLAPEAYRDTFEGMPAMPHVLLQLEEFVGVRFDAPPGQQRFDFQWDVFAPNLIGLVLIIDVTKAETFGESRRSLEAFLSYQQVPYVIALWKSESPQAFNTDEIRQIFHFPKGIPIFAFDPLQINCSAQILTHLFSAMLSSVHSA